MKCFTTLALFIAAAVAAPSSSKLQERCGTILWDGRIPAGTPLTSFDEYATARIFDAKYVLGQGQAWSKVLSYPNVSPSHFDSLVGASPVELSINDQSIFNPGSPQPGFRRSELLPSGNNGQDVTVQGTTTIHFSIQENPSKPLNYSHEYQLVFQETNDYASHVWTLKTGTSFNTTPVPGSNARTLRLEDSGANGRARTVLYSVPFGTGSRVWHNWAITNNWVSGQISVHYSSGDAPLRQVVAPRSNPNSGKGQAHIGILKMPLAPASNPVTGGYQPSGINESVIYGGIFIEDSTGNYVTLQRK